MRKTCKGFLMLMLSAGISANAVEVTHASVNHNDGIYSVEFDAVVTATQGRMFHLLSDYDNLDLVSDSIIESSRLDSPDPSKKKHRFLLDHCILFFCRTAVLIEDITTNNRDEITAIVDPENSDFSYGESVWKILPVDAQHSSVVLRSKIRPDFWIPPVIGPWLVKKSMIRELSVMLERLEQYAGTVPAR